MNGGLATRAKVTLVRPVLAVLVIAITFLPGIGATPAWAPTAVFPAHHAVRGFQNVSPSYEYPLLRRTLRVIRRGLQPAVPRGTPPAMLANDGAYVRSNGHVPTVTWIGHSTFLVQLDGMNILTDPIWADRASPVRFAGPRRLIPPAMRFEDLPRIDAVVISHDHYDHLDADTVRRLAHEHAPRFFVPLGLRAWLADEGIGDVVELDWGESAEFRGLTFVCTPAQHSSGRGLRDQNLRLWASWVVTGAGKRFFFAGDTGYDASLADIGRRFGPFDLAALPIGGYAAYPGGRHPNHLSPEEAVQLFQELGGGLMVPMHFATFDMNQEPFAEPPARLVAEAERSGVREQVRILSPGETLRW
jgi:N-acyl-phosphatidylethanolamine-hydrolysing phospholipase D